MTKNKAILIRAPEAIKRELQRQAKEQSRSLSAHILHIIKRGLATNAFKAKGGAI